MRISNPSGWWSKVRKTTKLHYLSFFLLIFNFWSGTVWCRPSVSLKNFIFKPIIVMRWWDELHTIGKLCIFLYLCLCLYLYLQSRCNVSLMMCIAHDWPIFCPGLLIMNGRGAHPRWPPEKVLWGTKHQKNIKRLFFSTTFSAFCASFHFIPWWWYFFQLFVPCDRRIWMSWYC